MSKIGKRIKSVILKGKTFWNWKKEDGINVSIPVPKDYRNKVSYETNVEFVFNREVIASYSYNDPSQIPAMEDIIPAGYKLLYDNENTIQPYNNNRYVLVYDYYDLIVHYRDAASPNTDLKVFKGRYQYGTLITANMIDWPAGKNGKEEWIEFPIGELTPARVTDKYVYFTNGSSSSTSVQPVSESMRQGTSIQLSVHEADKEYDSESAFVIPQGYIDNDYLQKYIRGRLPLGVHPNSDFSVNVRKGEVNIFDITSKTRRIPETPQAYYVGRNVDIRTTQYVTDTGETRTRFEIAPIIWYDEDDPAFAVFKSNNINDIKTFFNNNITRMRNEYIDGYRIPGGTYAAPFNSSTKMINILFNSCKIFEINGMPPFIYMMNRAIFNFNEERFYPFTPAVFNIGDVLTNFETNGASKIVDYYKTRKFAINTDVVNQNFKYKRIENFSYDGKTGDLLVYLVPLKRMKYIGLYLGDKNGNMYKNYFSNMSSGNPVISAELMNDMYAVTVNANNMIHEGLKKTTYRELKDATGKSGYDQFKSADGDRFSLTNDYTTKYIHRHKPSETNASQVLNFSAIAQGVAIDETSILIEHKKNTVNIADDVTQKYRIHFFDETGSEMKHYYTDQIIKEGTPPSPYPPRGYIVDPNRPWTRNPDNNKEIYVYLIKKICRVIVKAKVSNPSNIKNKYWNAILGDNILLDTSKYVGEKISPAILFEGFKNTHSAKLKSVQIEDSVYNSMAELEIEDSITITFNFKVFKTDGILSVLKLSEARKEFGIINPYFDYSLVAINVKRNALKPTSVFEAENGTRTNKLVRYKTDLTAVREKPLVGALETDIAYTNADIRMFDGDRRINIKVYHIKNGIKTLKYETTEFNLSLIYPNKIVYSGSFTRNSRIGEYYGSSCSNLTEFLVSDINALNDRDTFRIAYANSPDFINEGDDIEIQIEWSDEMINYESFGSALDIRIMPTALVPNDTGSLSWIGLNKKVIRDMTNMHYLYGENTPSTFKITAAAFYPNTVHTRSLDETFDVVPYGVFMNVHTMETIKVTNLEMYINTGRFTLRPWSIFQILSRPIPVFKIDSTFQNIPSASNRFSVKWSEYQDSISNYFSHLQYNYNIRENDRYVMSLINKDKSKILNERVISRCWNFDKPLDKLDIVSDDMVVINKQNRVVEEYTCKIDHPEVSNILMHRTRIVDDEYYGVDSIESWFKLMITISTMPSNTRIEEYIDAFELIKYGYKSATNAEVHNNPKGYKLVDFSYVKQDTEHPYINTNVYKPNGRTRYIFHPKPSTANIYDNSVSFIRNYLEDGRVMKTYVSRNGDVIKKIENSAYKGYLEGKPKFVDYVVSEISYASKLYNRKEFYFISAGLFNSKEEVLNSNAHDMNYDRFGDIFDIYKNMKGYKDLVDKGEIVKYPADKKVFDKDSVIKLIYSGNNYHAVSDIRHLKWHAIEEDNPTVVLDFERKYALDFVTPYSRNIIIPDLDKLVDYAFDRDKYNRFLISDSSTWMEPVMWIAGGDYGEPVEVEGVGYVPSPDKKPQEFYSNSVYLINSLSDDQLMLVGDTASYQTNDKASRLYYALLMHDIYNNKKDDGYAVKQELYNPDDIIKYKYVRYPDNAAVDKFVNIHMYNNTVVSSDGETAIHLKASRYDYRFHPNSIHVKIFGYNMYDLLFKATSIVDLHSNDPNIGSKSYGNDVDYNIVYRWKLDKDIAARENRRFNYSIGLPLVDEVKSIKNTNKATYLKDTNKQIRVIAPNIRHNFGISNINNRNTNLYNGDVYRPVMFNDEDIQGLNFKNSPANSFYINENRTFMKHSSNNDKYKLINPYALLEYNNGTPTGVTFEDTFRKAWDPYTGHRFTGRTRLMSDLKYLYVTSLYNHYSDPYNITTNWMLRVSKNMIHYGGAWSDERLVNDPSLINKTLNLIEQGLPQDPITSGSERYKSGLNHTHPIIMNVWQVNGQSFSEHPMNIRYICHPFQRTCLVLIRLVTDNPAAGNTNIDSINLPVYMGYVNIRYEEINKRKNDPAALKAYIKECALREDSGYKYYLKSFKYPYIFDTYTNKLFAFDVLENDPLDIRVTYVENHNDPNPTYRFSAEFVLRAHIIGEDVKKPANADICVNKSLIKEGSNAIILYMLDLKNAGFVRNRSDSGHLLNEEFYDGIKFLSTHSLERIDAAPKYNIPEYLVHKYSILNGVKRFGWSAYNGQYLPKWPAFIPDNISMLVSQNLLLIKDTVSVTSLNYNPTIIPLRLLNTNIMFHPNFTGGIKDRKNEYVRFDSAKFYGSINIADVSDRGESFENVNPKLTGFEYYSNRVYDAQRPGKERAHHTVTELSGIAMSSYYIKYLINGVASVNSKWFKQKSYEQIHNVFMHKEDYGKSVIHESVAAATPQDYLNKVYETLQQPSLSSKGVSNFNLWDDNSSIGFRMDLNPMSTNIVYPKQRLAPTAIQLYIPMIFRRDTETDFYRQRQYWTGTKNYEITEIAFNPYESTIGLYKPWK